MTNSNVLGRRAFMASSPTTEEIIPYVLLGMTAVSLATLDAISCADRALRNLIWRCRRTFH